MLWAIPSFVAHLRRWSSKRDSLTFRSPVHKSYLDLLVLMSKPVSPLEFCGFFKLFNSINYPFGIFEVLQVALRFKSN